MIKNVLFILCCCFLLIGCDRKVSDQESYRQPLAIFYSKSDKRIGNTIYQGVGTNWIYQNVEIFVTSKPIIHSVDGNTNFYIISFE